MSSFLDNSGDIILDAVLTDIGRQRLARADGSFKITHFSFGDDEINYALYNNNASTARKDIEILKAPVFEAFTNSSTGLQHRLVTLTGRTRNQTLYLPVARVNTKNASGPFPGYPYASSDDNGGTENQFVVLANQLSVDKYLKTSSLTTRQIPIGFINGVSPANAASTTIVVDQGIDNTAISYVIELPDDLNESVFVLQADSRILRPVGADASEVPASFTDTDNISTYVISFSGRNNPFFREGATGADDEGYSPIQGSRGRSLLVSFVANTNVATSDFLFDQIGTTKTNYFPTQQGSGNRDAKVIDAVVRLTGNTTGISVDLPIRVVKAIS